MTLTFHETRGFTQTLSEFFPDDDSYRLFQNSLLKNPLRGDRIQGTGGLRKTRWSDPRRGKGTRGGIRVIYLLVPERQTVIFIRAYSKAKQDDLTPEQRKGYAAAAGILRREVLGQ